MCAKIVFYLRQRTYDESLVYDVHVHIRVPIKLSIHSLSELCLTEFQRYFNKQLKIQYA